MTQTGDGTTSAVKLLRKLRYDEPSWFEGMPSHISGLILEVNEHYRMKVKEYHEDIARGLVNGYKKNPEVFERFAAGGVAGMDELVNVAAASSSSPLATLMGADVALVDVVAVKNAEQVAGLSRLARGGIDPVILRSTMEKFDAAKAPSMEEMDGFTTKRLYKKFGVYESWFEHMDCSDLEKYRILRMFCYGPRSATAQLPRLSWMFLQVERRGLPLHRVIWAFALTGDAEMALEVWDMPDDYINLLAQEKRKKERKK